MDSNEKLFKSKCIILIKNVKKGYFVLGDGEVLTVGVKQNI